MASALAAPFPGVADSFVRTEALGVGRRGGIEYLATVLQVKFLKFIDCRLFEV